MPVAATSTSNRRVMESYHCRWWQARQAKDDVSGVCPLTGRRKSSDIGGLPAPGATEIEGGTLLVAVVQASNLPTWNRSHDLYCVLSRDLDIRQTGVAERTGVYPEWEQEVVRFPLFLCDPGEHESVPGPSTRERNFNGGRYLYVSCGTDEDGFIGMALVNLSGVFLSRRLSMWYLLEKNLQECGRIMLEISIVERQIVEKPKRRSPRSRLHYTLPPQRELLDSGSGVERPVPPLQPRRFTAPPNLELPDGPPVTDLTGQVTKAEKFSSAGGGFSDVWKGYWETDSQRRQVAIKVLRINTFDENSWARLQRRLKRELSVWRWLDHKNVIPLHGITSGFAPTSAMVCPWFEKGNLFQYLRKHGSWFPLVQRLRLLVDIASGLSYLHEQEVVHGDLKGANVLIDDDGGACLCDFGLSSLVAENDGPYFTSTIGATVRWAAPEVHCRRGSTELAITPAGDIYSFGSVMLETLTAQLPYYDLRTDAEVVLELHEGRRPRRPPEPKIMEDHWALIMDCWADEPLHRPDVRTVSAQIRQFHFDALLP